MSRKTIWQHKDEIKRLHLEGLPDRVIGERISYSTSRVSVVIRTLKQRGELEPGRRKGGVRPVVTPEQAQEAARLYSEGWEQQEIGRKLHISRGTVAKTLKEQGVELRKTWRRGNKPEYDQAEAEHIDWLYHGLGYSQREVAEAMGFSSATQVTKRMQKYGIPSRPFGETNSLRHKRGETTERERQARREVALRRHRQNGSFTTPLKQS